LSVSELASGGNLQDKYDELVRYTVNLEKDTLKLQCERDDLARRVDAKANEFEFQLWHILLAMILSALLLQVPQYL